MNLSPSWRAVVSSRSDIPVTDLTLIEDCRVSRQLLGQNCYILVWRTKQTNKHSNPSLPQYRLVHGVEGVAPVGHVHPDHLAGIRQALAAVLRRRLLEPHSLHQGLHLHGGHGFRVDTGTGVLEQN